MHSAHTTFVGSPLPQHSLLSGQTWWGSHTWRAPSGNTVNDFHDPHKPSNWRSKVDVSRIFAQDFPKLGPDLTDGSPHTINLHVFLRPWVWSMNLIKSKNPGVNESQKIAHDMRRGPPAPSLMPPALHLVWGACRKLTKFLGSSLKVVPRPSEAFSWTDEKPYKCIGSE